MTASSPLVTPDERGADLSLRDQLSYLRGILAISTVMTERTCEEEIVHLARTAVPSIFQGTLEGFVLAASGWHDGGHASSDTSAVAQLLGQLQQIGDNEGDVVLPERPWSRAFTLRAAGSHIGHCVISSNEPPKPAELFLLGVLTQQAGVALGNARLHIRQRAATSELRAANLRLAQTVDTLNRKTAIHDRFTRIAMGGGGQQGIVSALHELTGFPAAVEDQYGNLVAAAGPVAAEPREKASPARRTHLIKRALRATKPIRADGSLLAVANPSEDVIGVLLLNDPDGSAREQDSVALEHAATVLATELARLRSVADTELRLGRDFIADLISGIDDPSALTRSRALGYDLERPHNIAVIQRTGRPADSNSLLYAVRQAIGGGRPGLLVKSHGADIIVLSANHPEKVIDHWEQFYTSLCQKLGSVDFRIGIGGSYERPSQLARSYHEARLALRINTQANGHQRVVSYSNLGVYQLLAEVPDTGGVEQFINRWLGSLLEYDSTKNSDLVNTLTSYLELGGNYDRTAESLMIGRSTLKYRLRRIREISGMDILDPDTHFNLHLATRARTTLVARTTLDNGSKP